MQSPCGNLGVVLPLLPLLCTCKITPTTLGPDAARAKHMSGVNKNADAINSPCPGSRWAGLCCHDDDVNVGVE